MVEHNKSSLLSAPQDIDRLAMIILTLMNDSEMRMRMGKYGRERTVSYFTPERIAHDMVLIYSRILNPKKEIHAISIAGKKQ